MNKRRIIPCLRYPYNIIEMSAGCSRDTKVHSFGSSSIQNYIEGIFRAFWDYSGMCPQKKDFARRRLKCDLTTPFRIVAVTIFAGMSRTILILFVACRLVLDAMDDNPTITSSEDHNGGCEWH